jgi:integrase
MSKIIKLQVNVPEMVPKKTIELKPMAKQYTLPKLFVPKDKNGKITIAKGKYWYVYYYFRNPETGALDSKSKFVVKHNINRLDSIAERKKYGKNLIEVYTELLASGFNPYEKQRTTDITDLEKSYNLNDALDYALEQKKQSVASNTYKDWESRTNKFKDFAKKSGFLNYPCQSITTKHFIVFLNNLEDKGLNSKTINNYRACLSSLFSLLVNDLVIENNPLSVIKKRKTNPVKNKPFTPEQINEIKIYLEKHDPVLLDYIRFVGYAFLRPVEICRIKVGDVHLKDNILYVKTKTEKVSHIFIIDALKEVIEKRLHLTTAKNDFLITPTKKAGPWPVGETTKTKHFSDAFKKVKKKFDFSDDYSIYSFRHSFALDIYKSFINEGLSETEAQLKMLPITRHKSLSGLRNYLRDIGSMLPKDYGHRYSIKL